MGLRMEISLKKKKTPDFYLLGAFVLLVVVGLVFVWSASFPRAMKLYGDPFFYFRKQFQAFLLGLLVFLFAYNLPLKYWRKYSTVLFIINVILLLAVFVPGLSVEAGGARRWLRVGPFSFQPSELAKVALPLFVADRFSRLDLSKSDNLFKLPAEFFITSAWVALLLLLVFFEPDMSTTLLLFLTFAMAIYIAGANPVAMVMMVFALVPFVVFAFFGKEYRLKRLHAFLNPLKDPWGSGYQIIQSKIAVAKGGLFGVGVGASTQKISYLPAAHTDYIFSVIAEETGFVGASLVLLLFLYITYRGVRVGFRVVEKDFFGGMLAFLLTWEIAFQVIINVLVALSSLPPTGVTLPAISYGKSSLIVTMAIMGLLLNISAEDVE